jgi:NADH-quinone oxidoreductase subunit F
LLAEYAAGGRSSLLPVLQAAQAHYGYISQPVAAEIGRGLGVPLADVHGVIDFYSLLYREPIGRTVVRVCTDPACALRGADAVLDAACRRAGVEIGGTSADGAYTVERSPCLGQCNAGVSVNVTHGRPAASITYAHVTPDALDDVFTARGRTTGSRYWTYDYVGGDLCVVTPLCGRGRSTKLIEYQAVGGMQALRQAQPIMDRLSPQLMLLDLREGPGRNDASFEAAMLPAIGNLLSRFARSAMLVKTAVGRLQLQRLGRETSMPMSVFHDEQEALRFLLE